MSLLFGQGWAVNELVHERAIVLGEPQVSFIGEMRGHVASACRAVYFEAGRGMI